MLELINTTLSYKFCLDAMEQAFKHRRVLLIQSFGLSFPFCKAIIIFDMRSSSIGFQFHRFTNSPAGYMSHPSEEFNQVSTWISCASDTANEIFDDLQGVITFGGDCRVAIDDGHNHRCRSTTKMLVPLRRFDEAIVGNSDSFCRLLFVKLLY